MPDTGVNIVPQSFWRGESRNGSKYQMKEDPKWIPQNMNKLALMPHTKFHSNRTDSSGEGETFLCPTPK